MCLGEGGGGVLRPHIGLNIIHTFSTAWTAMAVAHCIVLHRIIYMTILASLKHPKQITTL